MIHIAPSFYHPSFFSSLLSLTAFFSALINSMVHIIMYTYYFLSAFGDTFRPFLGWKRYLTMIQLVRERYN